MIAASAPRRVITNTSWQPFSLGRLEALEAYPTLCASGLFLRFLRKAKKKDGKSIADTLTCWMSRTVEHTYDLSIAIVI